MIILCCIVMFCGYIVFSHIIYWWERKQRKKAGKEELEPEEIPSSNF